MPSLVRLLALPLALAAVACAPSATDSGNGGGAGGKSDDPYASSRHTELVLTAPYCDVCTAGDKQQLLDRSPVIARVIALIDGARDRIDIAQFTFSVRAIEDALIAAHQRGIEVRVAIDAGQDNPGTVATRLRDAGVPVHFVAGKPVREDFSGLQHAKFMVVDGTTLLTGSNNWSSTGTSINEENTMVFESAADDPLLAGFACHFEAIWARDYDGAGACSNDVVAFAPSSAPIRLLRDAIRGSQRSVDVLMHHLVFGDLVKELAKAAERGVRVRVIVNLADRGEVEGSNWNRLAAAGGQVRFKQSNPELYQLMHHKLAIIDDQLVVNGSGNWSGSAFFNNFENYLRLTDPLAVQRMRRLYRRLWQWSLSPASVDAGLDAAAQDRDDNSIYFGNLHAHFTAPGADHPLDDGEPHQVDADGGEVELDVGNTISESARFAYEYARDVGELDFLALSPHTVDDRAGDPADLPSMSQLGYQELRGVADEVSASSEGRFVAFPGMEWNTNSLGNHVNVLGSRELAKTERGRFDLLWDEFLPRRAAGGDTPIVQLNHPRTFRHHEEFLTGNWDLIFDTNLLDIPKAGERTKKLNDYGLDDYPPVSDHLDAWLAGDGAPDRTTVYQGLANLERAASPYARLMEVTVGRGTELASEVPTNPSLSIDAETGEVVRYVKAHSDWDFYLLRGFRLAPTANHDNHRANWGTGHTSRTAIIAAELSQDALLAAMDDRRVYASEDQNLAIQLHAGGRVPMGGSLTTLSASVPFELWLDDPDYEGAIEVAVYVGRIGGDAVEVRDRITTSRGQLTRFDVALDAPGEWFAYVEVYETGADRMAWSAPIWLERL